MDLLVFELNGQRYGLALSGIQEIVRAVAITHLPGAPSVVEGVINYRGTVVPVLDIRSRFGLPFKPLEPRDQFIIAHLGRPLVALRVDRADWPVNVSEETIHQVSGTVAEAPHIAGVCTLPDGVVLIHDLDTFLTSSESAELSSALSQTATHSQGI